MTNQQVQTQWHQLFGAVLEELLTPVGITVQTEVDISSKPPQVDVLLLQRQQTSTWTEEQRRYLPDGVRDSQAGHILLEFKYTESVNETAVRKIVGYDIFYQQARQLSGAEVQSFIVSARTPRLETLTRFGYQQTEQAGVYQSSDALLQSIPLLALNELEARPHNVFFKLFASRMQAKAVAVTGLQQWWLKVLPTRLHWLIQGLLNLWFMKGDQAMETITPEQLIKQGKMFKELLLPMLTMEEMEETLRDTPYVQRIREESWKEGVEKGFTKGREEGREKGREEGREEGREKGREEGREKGREAMVKTISHILTIRFTVELDHFNPALKPLSLSTLEALSEIALTIDTLANFEARLNELASQQPDG